MILLGPGSWLTVCAKSRGSDLSLNKSVDYKKLYLCTLVTTVVSRM